MLTALPPIVEGVVPPCPIRCVTPVPYFQPVHDATKYPALHVTRRHARDRVAMSVAVEMHRADGPAFHALRVAVDDAKSNAVSASRTVSLSCAYRSEHQRVCRHCNEAAVAFFASQHRRLLARQTHSRAIIQDAEQASARSIFKAFEPLLADIRAIQLMAQRARIFSSIRREVAVALRELEHSEAERRAQLNGADDEARVICFRAHSRALLASIDAEQQRKFQRLQLLHEETKGQAALQRESRAQRLKFIATEIEELLDLEMKRRMALELSQDFAWTQLALRHGEGREKAVTDFGKRHEACLAVDRRRVEDQWLTGANSDVVELETKERNHLRSDARVDFAAQREALWRRRRDEIEQREVQFREQRSFALLKDQIAFLLQPEVMLRAEGLCRRAVVRSEEWHRTRLSRRCHPTAISPPPVVDTLVVDPLVATVVSRAIAVALSAANGRTAVAEQIAVDLWRTHMGGILAAAIEVGACTL